MKRHIRIQHQQKEETHAAQNEEVRQNTHEFSTADEMIRHDALHTPVPPSLANRLQESVGETSFPKEASWWRKMLGLGP